VQDSRASVAVLCLYSNMRVFKYSFPAIFRS